MPRPERGPATRPRLNPSTLHAPRPVRPTNSARHVPRGPGYLGGKLTGAGKGGCVSLLVRQERSQAMCEYLDREYYGRPERFEFYRQVLEDDRDNSEPGSPEYESAIERLKILEAALANIPEQRRVITFSRGACALEPPGRC